MLSTVQDYIDAKLTHSIHTSERKSFRGCRRRWHWIFRDMYYPQVTAKPLEFGVAYHKGMETYYAPETWEWTRHEEQRQILINSAIGAFNDTVKDQAAKYEKTFGPMEAEVAQDYHERLELGLGMLRYHLGKVAPELDLNIRPRKVEVSFEVPITNPDTGEQLYCKCQVCWSRYRQTDDFKQRVVECEAATNDPHRHAYEEDLKAHFKGLPVTYGGRIDAVMEDDLGRIWVFDWKTAARIADRTDFLLVEDQITSYLWALWVLGLDVAGFIYHEQKKAFPVEPEPLTRRYMGKLYSTNKQQDTTYELYKATVEENDPGAFAEGLYDPFLEYLQEEGAVYSARYNVPRSETELENYGRVLYEEASDMVDENLRLYPNPGRFSCGNCAFQTPCVGKNRNEDYEYTLNTMFEKRTYHYWEEAPLTTEAEGRVLGIGYGGGE